MKDVYKSRVLNCVNNYFQKRQSLHDRNLRDIKNVHVPVA